MRTVSQLEQALTTILVRQLRLPEETILSHDTLLEDVGLDSLGMLSFIAVIERDFGVGISDRDYESLSTFGDAVALVERLTQ
ncbi:MAG TPA: acyl carrier protein [Dehalococcoidia bacterium]|nr:acyl carrier protein [Dehalococcoidia bacterium]